MKETPLLMKPDMVKATLDDLKTQTRRVIKNPEQWMIEFDGESHWFEDEYGEQKTVLSKCPYGQAGDKLWVRETLRRKFNSHPMWADYITYIADDIAVANLNPDERYPEFGRPTWIWQRNTIPSIHMPKWACRIWLEITEVRVGRLQEITEDGAIREGVPPFAPNGEILSSTIPRKHFTSLWDSINPKNNWESNPYVWVISFRRL